MPGTKNVFISHIHEDDELLGVLKARIRDAGMTVRDRSVTSKSPNRAHNEEYIMNSILKPRIRWASTMIVLISDSTHNHPWVDREIKYAAQLGKKIIGVFARGAKGATLPRELERVADSTIVGWQGRTIVRAIREDIHIFQNGKGDVNTPIWQLNVHGC